MWTKEGESERVKRVKDGNKETGPDPESPVTCNRPSLPRTRSLLLFCPTSPRSLHSLSLSPLSCWTAPSLSSLSRPNVCLHLACGPGGHASGRDAVHRQHLEQDRARAVHGKRHPRGSSCVADKATVKQTTASGSSLDVRRRFLSKDSRRGFFFGDTAPRSAFKKTCFCLDVVRSIRFYRHFDRMRSSTSRRLSVTARATTGPGIPS